MGRIGVYLLKMVKLVEIKVYHGKISRTLSARTKCTLYIPSKAKKRVLNHQQGVCFVSALECILFHGCGTSS